jgi:NAD+ diphosphatase
MIRAGYIRVCLNGPCKTQYFPRTDPIIIMLATREDKCLLGRSEHFNAGVYSALAGFMEPGESIEESVRREFMQEAGIIAGKVEYLKSQPWPFPSSLMIGCLAGIKFEKIMLHDGELEDARWFSKVDVQENLKGSLDQAFQTPTKMAIAYHLIKDWSER